MTNQEKQIFIKYLVNQIRDNEILIKQMESINGVKLVADNLVKKIDAYRYVLEDLRSIEEYYESNKRQKKNYY